MSKTYGPKPESFVLDDGERYYVGEYKMILKYRSQIQVPMLACT